MIEAVEEKLGYVFRDKNYLILALTHRSFINENREEALGYNERLEFLGDAILGFLVSEFLYTTLPQHQEGDLSFLRSRLVEASSCYQYMQKLGIQEFLRVGKGEAMNAGRGRESLLANLFEALLAAIYLDSGIESVREFFFKHYREQLNLFIKEPAHNWKALLQDYFQKKLQKQPIYKVLEETGPDHEKVFCVGVYLDEDQLGMGRGVSKKEAEQKAAQVAYRRLKKS